MTDVTARAPKVLYFLTKIPFGTRSAIWRASPDWFSPIRANIRPRIIVYAGLRRKGIWQPYMDVNSKANSPAA